MNNHALHLGKKAIAVLRGLALDLIPCDVDFAEHFFFARDFFVPFERKHVRHLVEPAVVLVHLANELVGAEHDVDVILRAFFGKELAGHSFELILPREGLDIPLAQEIDSVVFLFTSRVWH